MTLAPIAVFTHVRPAHTRQLFRTLLVNPEAADSPIQVFSDGPRTDKDVAPVQETRRFLHSLKHPKLTIIEREKNVGLAASIIDGVNRLCEEHGKVIVLEDDLYLSPTFLRFMNAALERYRASQSLFHVTGYMFPGIRPKHDVTFLPFIWSSGWGTWQRAWRHFDAEARGYELLASDSELRRRFDLDGHYYFYRMLEAFRQGRISSWAIRWYLTVFLRGGLTAFPARSLVENRGYGAAGTHTRYALVPPHGRAKAVQFRAASFPEPALDAATLVRVQRLLAKEMALPFRIRTKLVRVLQDRWRQLRW